MRKFDSLSEREILALAEPAVKLGDGLRAVRPQVLEDRGLPSAEGLPEIGLFSLAHRVREATWSILHCLVRRRERKPYVEPRRTMYLPQ